MTNKYNKTARAHVCDTDSPQRPCCWAARKAELEQMKAEEATRKAAREAHDALIAAQGGFITRGLD